mgnify:CR=1 FL=1
MAYKQKAEDLKNVAQSMKDKSSYGPSGGDPPQGTSKTSKNLQDSKVLATSGGEKAAAKAFTKQTGSTLFGDNPLWVSFKNQYASDHNPAKKGSITYAYKSPPPPK